MQINSAGPAIRSSRAAEHPGLYHRPSPAPRQRDAKRMLFCVAYRPKVTAPPNIRMVKGACQGMTERDAHETAVLWSRER